MSSDLFLLDDSFFRHSSDNMGISIPSDFSNLLQFSSSSSEPIFPFVHDDQFLQLIDSNPTTPLEFPTNPSPIVTNPFLSSSPPSQEFDNLSLGGDDQLHSMVPTSAIFGNGGGISSASDNLSIKPEDCYVGFHYTSSSSSQAPPHLLPINEKLMQRSFSSHSLDQKPGFLFHPHLDSLLETPNFSTQIVGSPENSIFNGTMRRVCSTGDLQRFKRTHSSHGHSSSPLAAAENNNNSSLLEEVTFKARPYNAEERKQRIHRYKSKRTQRNFNKTIKYACRKTLADSRPRVRGRFARNDETGEIPKVTGINRGGEEDDEDELWFHEDSIGGEVFDLQRRIRNENQYFGSSSSSTSSAVGSCSLSWKGLSSAAKVFSSDL